MAPQPPGNSGAPSPAVKTLPRPGAPTGTYDRVPPHNLDAEVSVLGGMLLSKDAIAEVSELVGPEDFYRGAHRTMFEGIRDLYDRGEPVDAVTLADALEGQGQLEDVGGSIAITDLIARVPTAANALYYARIVADHAMRRRLIDAGTQIAKLGYEPAAGVADAVDTAESLVFAVAQRGRGAGEFVPMKRLLRESMDLLEQLQDNDSAVTGLETGFLDFDGLTAGLQPGNLIILAARPSMGKTTLVMNMAAHVAVETRKPVVMFSLEMSTAELVQRLLSAEARIDSKRLRTGHLEDRDWIKLSQATGRLAEAPLFLDDNSAINLMEIRSKCRRLKQEHGLDLVVVDYLQLMQSHRRVENRVQEVSELSRGLKILAKELSVPVVALSQLSRKPEDRTDRRPQLADLRESGCLTADARVLRADTGAEVSLAELLASGERDIPVWTVDQQYQLTRGTMSHVFASGVKETYALLLDSGRSITASANHPFLTYDGWRRLDELREGTRLAVPRVVRPPEQIIGWADDEVILLAQLMRDAGVMPPAVFGLDDRQVALFLGSLWGADGQVGLSGRTITLSYASTSRRLVDGLQLLLLRLGVQTRLRSLTSAGCGPSYRLEVDGADSQRRFLDRVRVDGVRGEQQDAVRCFLAGIAQNTDADTVPIDVWEEVDRRRVERGLSERAFAGALGVPSDGTPLYRSAPSRLSLAHVAEVLHDQGLRELAESDLFWDRVVEVRPMGPQPVYDATVHGTHNFVANGIVVENSIEQDADIVAFIYRDEVYNEESAAKGEAELIVAKHRNGPLKTVRLSFLGHHSRFANMARGLPPPSQL